MSEPNFIIIGAMKCGTTSMHHVLKQHPKIFMPEGEIRFFTLDDVEQQPWFLPLLNGRWDYHAFEANKAKYFEWYEQLYTSCPVDVVLGEDAPSYLPSRKAPKRIAARLPDVRLIVMLRDPVDRLYSHYWHNVSNYTAFMGFEDTIRHAPDLLINRSCYKAQIEEYLRYFDPSQFRFVIFEEFVADQAKVIEEVVSFLGLPIPSPIASVRAYSNRTRIPRFPSAALLRNALFRSMRRRNYFNSLRSLPHQPPRQSLLGRLALKALNRMNPRKAGKPPEMSQGTRKFLQALMRRENGGLDEIVQIDLSRYWPTFRD